MRSTVGLCRLAQNNLKDVNCDNDLSTMYSKFTITDDDWPSLFHMPRNVPLYGASYPRVEKAETSIGRLIKGIAKWTLQCKHAYQ